MGSGIPRILEAYGKECFHFSENFLRMVFPAIEKVTEQVTEQVTGQVTEQVTEQVKRLIVIMDQPYSRNELMDKLGLSHREYFRKEYLQKALELDLITLTIPDKPKSSKQKYRLTHKGQALKQKIERL